MQPAYFAGMGAFLTTSVGLVVSDHRSIIREYRGRAHVHTDVPEVPAPYWTTSPADRPHLDLLRINTSLISIEV